MFIDLTGKSILKLRESALRILLDAATISITFSNRPRPLGEGVKLVVSVRGADDGIKTGVRFAHPGNSPIKRTEPASGRRPYREFIPGVSAATRASICCHGLPGVRFAHPGLHAVARSARSS
jgi:hypothetical protein